MYFQENIKCGATVVAQWLNVFLAVTGKRDSVPSITSGNSQEPVTPFTEDEVLKFSGTPRVYGARKPMQILKCTYKQIIVKK